MSEERRGILADILREMLTPIEERIEKITQDTLEIKETLKRLEAQQDLLIKQPKE